MHPLVHSPTQTTLKSKWHSIKTWFTPDFNKRRPSQCSTASTASSSSCCCQEQQQQQHAVYVKRPSLTGSESLHIVVDKCMSPFRRRPSNASSVVTFNLDIEIKKLMELYQLALDELNYAEDSRGSPYYTGDRVAAKEAIDHCQEAYQFLAEQCSPQQHEELKIAFELNIKKLVDRLNSLPLQDDDQLSF